MLTCTGCWSLVPPSVFSRSAGSARMLKMVSSAHGGSSTSPSFSIAEIAPKVVTTPRLPWGRS
jgi:hypothetical protein